MTKTALENKAIKSKERIADKDRALEEKIFKHKKGMDVANILTGGLLSLFKGGKGAKRNGPEFYKNYVKDIDKFTNLSTWVRLGDEMYQGKYHGFHSIAAGTGNITLVSKAATPGIAVTHWEPTIGQISSGSNDLSETPINQILMRTKEQVLKSNSRSNVPYEASDLGYNFLATASILLAICEYEKLVTLCQTYRADNSYYARRYLVALGVGNPDNWMNHLADAQQALVLLKKRFNSALVAPADLSLYKKYVYLGTAWMKDSETEPASIYTFSANHYLKLSNDTSTLEPVLPNRATPEAFATQINAMIQVIAENPDFQAMYADLRSAFTNLLSIDENHDSNAKLDATYDSMGIEQMANMQTAPILYNDTFEAGIPTSESLTIRQDDNGYIYQGASVSSQGVELKFPASEMSGVPTSGIMHYYNTNHLFNFHKDNITGDDVLDISRWHLLAKTARMGVEDESFYLRFESSDVALATDITYTVLGQAAGSAFAETKLGGSLILCTDTTSGQYGDLIDTLEMALAFDWHPLVTFAVQTASTLMYRTFGDVQHLVSVGPENIKSLNKVCVLSEFYLDSPAFKTPR